MVVDDLGHRSPADRRSIEVDAIPLARVSAQAAVFDDVGDPHRGDQCDEKGAGSLSCPRYWAGACGALASPCGALVAGRFGGAAIGISGPPPFRA